MEALGDRATPGFPFLYDVRARGATVYLYCVTNWGNVPYIMTITGSSLGIISATGGVSVLILQSFLVLRVGISPVASDVLEHNPRDHRTWCFCGSYPGCAGSRYPESDPGRANTITENTLFAGTLITYLQIAQHQAAQFRQSVLSRPLKMLIRTILMLSWELFPSTAGSSMLFYMGRISALTLLYNANLKKNTTQAMSMPSGLVTLSSSTLSRVPFTGTSNGSFGRWGHQKEATPYQGGTPGLEVGDSSLSHPAAGTHRFMSPSDFAQDTDYENPEGNSN